MNVALWLQGMRPKTLPASIAPVLVGAALSWHESIDGRSPDVAVPPIWFWGSFAGCLIVALALQIAVNFANDYSDGIRGTDAGRSKHAADNSRHGQAIQSQRGPARLVATGVPPKHVLAAAGIAAAVACVTGLAVIAAGGRWWLLAVGVASLVAGWCYTGGRHPYGYAGFGEFFVFLFFGPVAVSGTQYAILGMLGRSDVLVPAAMVAGLNAVILLMVNNLRDIDSDRRSGKRTFAVRVGRSRATVALYAVLGLSVAISVTSLPQSSMSGWWMVVPLSYAGYVGTCVHAGDYRRALASAGLFCLLSALCWVVTLSF